MSCERPLRRQCPPLMPLRLGQRSSVCARPPVRFVRRCKTARTLLHNRSTQLVSIKKPSKAGFKKK